VTDCLADVIQGAADVQDPGARFHLRLLAEEFQISDFRVLVRDPAGSQHHQSHPGSDFRSACAQVGGQVLAAAAKDGTRVAPSRQVFLAVRGRMVQAKYLPAVRSRQAVVVHRVYLCPARTEKATHRLVHEVVA